MRSTLIRYILLQIPAWLLLACVMWWLVSRQWLETSTALWVMALWTAKDALLYPWSKPAYEHGGPPTGADALIGLEVKTVSDLNPHGTVQVDGELWKARASDYRHVPSGRRVVITGAKDLELVVRTPEPDNESHGGGTGE